MINYWPLKYVSPKSTRNRAIKGLQSIRALASRLMPERTVHDTLVLGSWNIRNFDDNRFGHGPRLTESLYYIAEVISAFDVVAIQEICRDMGPIQEVMKLLGKQYDLILTDVTEGPSGNKERIGFIYNTNKVWFRNVAGEIVLPFKKQISDVTKQRQFARTPFSCCFQAGWFKFVFSTVHIYYGKNAKSSPAYKRRVKEIDAIAKFLKDRAGKETDNYILVGDFNIDVPGDEAYNALEKHGFEIVKNNVGSNAKQNKFYDQISWLPNERKVQQSKSDRKQGVLDVFNAVFTDDEFAKYKKDVSNTLETNLDSAKRKLAEERSKGNQKKIDKAKKAVDNFKAMLNSPAEMENYYLNTWRTFQISDHLPLWVELEVDFSADYLEWLKAGEFEV